MYLSRTIDKYLLEWKNDEVRKPLMLRGARQVGKSSSVREFSKKFEYFLEVNFEENKDIHGFFAGNLSPETICKNLSLVYDTPVIPGKTLIFFDEIQACIPAISSLRFFYEKIPGLHLISAGSLLEFALEELPSFGVGRIRSMFMYPLSFNEFLLANDLHALSSAIEASNINDPLSDPVHNRINTLLKEFLIIGGMPEVVAKYAEKGDLRECQQVLDDLIISLQADFSKYRHRIPSLRVRKVFESVVYQSGRKFIFSKAVEDANFKQIHDAVELLILAQLVIPITHSSANGLPLGAESNPKKRKLMLLDSGVTQRILNLQLADILLSDDFDVVNKGSIAEQFVGLELIKSTSPYQAQQLFYWHREARNSNAEVDYIFQKGNLIIPLEVKSGIKGKMHSLRLFMSEKKSSYGIRTSLENYSKYDKIVVMPLYALSKALFAIS